MPELKDLVGKVVSFSLYAPAVLGTGFTNVRVVGAATADMAKAFGDIITQHAQVYSSLPPGTVDNYRAYDYLLIKTANGNTIPIGFPWIQGTPTISESSITTFTYRNLTAEQIRDLTLIARANGYTDFTVNTQDI